MRSPGQIIAHYRKAQNMTQKELADGICSRPYLSRLEMGTRLPSPRTLASLSDRLQAPLDELAQVYLDEPNISPSARLKMALQLAERNYTDESEKIYWETAKYLRNRKLESEFADELICTRAQILFAQGNYKDALEKFKEVLTIRKRRPSESVLLAEAQYMTAHAALKVGKCDLAKKLLYGAFSRIIAIDPQKADQDSQIVTKLHLNTTDKLSDLLLKKDNFEATLSILQIAKTRWQDLKILPEWPMQLRYKLAVSQIDSGRFDDAENILNKIYNDTSDAQMKSKCAHKMGIVQLKRKTLFKSLTCQLEAWDLAKNLTDYEIKSSIVSEISWCYLLMNDLASAEKWLKRARKIEGHSNDFVINSLIETLHFFAIDGKLPEKLYSNIFKNKKEDYPTPERVFLKLTTTIASKETDRKGLKNLLKKVKRKLTLVEQT